MHYSGIIVVARPLAVDDCRRRLENMPGVEVHYCVPESGRLVVVQETADVESQEAGLRRIQALPEVAWLPWWSIGSIVRARPSTAGLRRRVRRKPL